MCLRSPDINYLVLNKLLNHIGLFISSRNVSTITFINGCVPSHLRTQDNLINLVPFRVQRDCRSTTQTCQLQHLQKLVFLVHLRTQDNFINFAPFRYHRERRITLVTVAFQFCFRTLDNLINTVAFRFRLRMSDNKNNLRSGLRCPSHPIPFRKEGWDQWGDGLVFPSRIQEG